MCRSAGFESSVEFGKSVHLVGTCGRRRSKRGLKEEPNISLVMTSCSQSLRRGGKAKLPSAVSRMLCFRRALSLEVQRTEVAEMQRVPPLKCSKNEVSQVD